METNPVVTWKTRPARVGWLGNAKVGDGSTNQFLLNLFKNWILCFEGKPRLFMILGFKHIKSYFFHNSLVSLAHIHGSLSHGFLHPFFPTNPLGNPGKTRRRQRPRQRPRQRLRQRPCRSRSHRRELWRPTFGWTFANIISDNQEYGFRKMFVNKKSIYRWI